MGTEQFFTFNLNDLNLNNEQFMEICKSHPGCEDCPLKTEDKKINGTIIRCNTGRGDIR